MVIGVFHVACIDLHLTAQDRLEGIRHVVPGGDLFVANGKLAVRRDDTKFLLPGECLLTQFVPPLVELALVLVGPVLGYMVRGMGSAGCEIDKEGFVRGQGFLLTDPFARLLPMKP